MKIRTISLALLLFALCLAPSCVEQSPEYVPGEAPTGAQVFFPNDVTIGTISLDESKPFTVPVTRVDNISALTVNLTSSAAPAFIIPSTVEFAAGAKDAYITISYDASQFVRGETYPISITLGNETTPYGASTYDFSFYINPWESLGMGQWFDELALSTSSSYGIQPVEVLHNGVQPDLYRIMNPYANNAQLAASWSADNIGGPKSEYIEFRVLADGVHVTWDKWWYTGLIYTPGDNSSSIKAYLPSALSSSQTPNDAYSLFVEDNVVQFYPYYYIDGVGSFGCYYCYLSLPGGPDLNTWL